MIMDIIQINFVPVLLGVLFTAYVAVDRCFSKRTRAYFFTALCVILLLIFIDDVEYVELRRGYATVVRYIETSAGYIIRPMVAILVTAIFTETNNQKSTRTTKLIYTIPFMINFFVVVGNPWNKLVYSYDEQNQFVRGPLGYITFLVGFFYMGYMVYVSLRNTAVRRKGEAAVIVMLAALCVIGTMMESLFGFIGFLAGSSIIGIVLYYLYLHVSIYSRDALTGAYNRRIFELDIKNINEQAVIVALDLNGLKAVNDQYGHAKGDEFIVGFSTAIMKGKLKSAQLYRTGGDEFILICKNASEEYIGNGVENLQENMNKAGYSFAYGIMTCNRDDDMEQIVKLVDQKMYRKKEAMKRAMAVEI